MERFNIVSKEQGVPLVAFSLKDNRQHNEFEISVMLRWFGWIVPAYTMPPNAQHITVLRVVIREDFSRTLAERLVSCIVKVLHELDTLPSKVNAKIIVSEEKGIENKPDLQVQRRITDAWRSIVPGFPTVVLRCTSKLANAVSAGVILASGQDCCLSVQSSLVQSSL